MENVRGPSPIAAAAVHPFLAGGGELGKLIAAFDWSSTSLGPLSLWPPGVKSIVSLILRSPVPMVTLWGEEGIMLYNDAYSVFAAGRHPHLLGSRVREGWPEVADFNDNVMKTVLSGGTLAFQDQELTLYRSGSAEQVWMNLDYSPILDESGAPAGVIAIVVETTAKVRAEQWLSGERERLRNMFEQAPGFMALLTGPNHVFDLVNPAYSQLVGHRDVVGRTVREVFPELEQQGFFEILDRVYSTGETFTGHSLKVELQPVPGGKVEQCYVDLVYQPVRNYTGETMGIFAQGMDITDRVVAEEQLRATEERYRLAARATNDAIWDWDLQSNCILWNEAVCSLFGYCEDDIDTAASWWTDHIHPEDRERVVSGIHAVIEGGGNHWSDEYRFLEADGAYADVLDRGYVLRNGSSQPIRMIGAMQDITDRKRFEEELAAARDAAETANQAKSQFIANMSHELRTPLTAVIGYCDMLEEEAQDLGIDEFLLDLQKINSNARHLLDLINDVLDISKIEAGKVEVHYEDFGISSLVSEVVNTAEALATKKHNRLKVNCPPEVGGMHSDVVKIRQCLFNLLSNASKFTENGQIELSVSREPSGDEDWVIFEVRDTGIGMTEEQVTKLFQRFSQGDVSTTRKFGGTGLGLAITKAFCTMLGGNISVESAKGAGTTFTIRLPADLKTALAKSSTDTAVIEANGIEDTIESADLVLVIDDDPSARDLLRRYLKRQNFAVLAASDGQTGIQLARARRPCAILLDVMMPQMDGWAVLSSLKADPELCDIPVIMVTMVREKQLGYSLGAAEYLTKPVQWTRLRSVLDKYRCNSAPGTALLVDANPHSRAELRQLIEAEGWGALEAQDRAGAMSQIAQKRPDLILVDLQAAAVDGMGLIHQLGRDPELHTIPVIALADRDLSQEEYTRLQGRVRQIIQDEGTREEELISELRKIASSKPASSCQVAIE